MFKRILVPVDGSDVSTLSLKRAIKLAQTFGAEIMVFHVIQLPAQLELFETYSGKLGDIYFQIKERIEKYGKNVLEKASEECSAHNISFMEKSVWGEPANEIIHEAQAGKYDLIIIGSHGLDDYEDWLLGNVCHRVVRRARCPVLVIR